MKKVVMVSMLLFAVVTANAAMVAEYDASAGFALPEDSGNWTVSQGLGEDYPNAVQDGGNALQVYLAYDADGYNGGDYANWTSNGTASMMNGTTNYSVEIKVQPLGDLISSGYSYEQANLRVQWSDNLNTYSMAFDKDSDDAGSGTTGKVASKRYPLTPVISGIDWSTPHVILAAYTGSTDTFAFYLDGVYQTSLLSSAFTGGYLGYVPDWKDKVNFGDSTSGGGDGTRGPDYNADYYFVRLYDTAIPEPATLALLALGGLFGLRKRS